MSESIVNGAKGRGSKRERNIEGPLELSPHVAIIEEKFLIMPVSQYYNLVALPVIIFRVASMTRVCGL